MEWPFSTAMGSGIAIVALSVGVIAALTTGLGPVIAGGALIALVLYLIYLIVINIHRWATTRYLRGGRRR